MENATVIIARGVIKAVGKDAAIPDEAWVVEGKGLIVYPGIKGASKARKYNLDTLLFRPKT